MNERNILCIDLKSFFASVECVERNLDPFTTPLIVADPSRKGGAITLAVTPYMKTLGVPSRGRVFEIPKNIKYITAPPRMSLYVKKSKEVINCFLDFISKEDMHVYSIDEAFLDVTDYLKLYKMDDVTLAKTIMARIKEKTGLTSTCGIGPNLLLAKVALDIESKHSPDFIAKWTYEDVKTKLWNITPLDEMWGIGSKTMKKLNDLGIYKVGDINKYSKDFYKKRFGVLGEELYLHANGIDNSNIKDDKYEIKNKSYGLSQILYKDYTPEEAILIIKEMCETICKRLRSNKKVCGVVGFGIGYSRSVGGGFYHSKKLSESTDNENVIFSVCKSIYDSYIEEEPIRKVSISLGKITDNNYVQLNLFEDIENKTKERRLEKSIIEIKSKMGKNSIIRGMNLEEGATTIIRNKLIGGHNGY